MGYEHRYILYLNLVSFPEGAKKFSIFLQEHINRKSTLTTYLISHYLLHAIPSRSIRRSFYSPLITRNLYICRQIDPSSFIRHQDVTTQRDCLATDEI